MEWLYEPPFSCRRSRVQFFVKVMFCTILVLNLFINKVQTRRERVQWTRRKILDKCLEQMTHSTCIPLLVHWTRSRRVLLKKNSFCFYIILHLDTNSLLFCSTVGMEASGTSILKFSMNGCLLLGPMDGANV